MIPFALTAILATVVLTAGQAWASASPSFCDGKSEEAVVRNYTRGPVVIPLRCGTTTYGFRHLTVRGRWNATFDAQIAQTIARGEVKPDATIYALFGPHCKELFRVVVNPGTIGGTGFRPQGIITAYATPAAKNTSQLIRPSSGPGNDVGDCPIVEDISGSRR